MRTACAPWRHRRVWLAPALRAQDICAGTGAGAVQAFIARAQQGLAVVGRSANADDIPGWRPLGLALARAQGGTAAVRLSCCVAPQSIARVQEPLPLRAALPALPQAMRGVAARLLEFDADTPMPMPLAVYGSVFWQHAAADSHWHAHSDSASRPRPSCHAAAARYLHERSDLDLLARPASADQARRWLDWVAAVEEAGSVRLDGEIELPSGAAVSWRELALPGPQILVKSDRGASLWPRPAVWAAWPHQATP
ncbi:malonate decarboxylase holo-[acyl-carrier-protein] synthase [Verminephrobacter eiseniae]|uniref:malonate decarboxylase holo-[acyl-carrier-protein] synthase n=1 Tax=Verminephrobacter eiseniae TaxID=364317 RepID=UPI0010DEAD57|nr:malonate decarboxylase holo-[acyl-carrier-protein] synthase [Verminephrobacter eiseniae]KAB7543899.1 hypothetical protein ET532_025630 [Verminephrobacter sp. Larva24]MCW5230680.1 hypothetical protein [Verminephrobacter eiseniae]MCW5292413.1 hypothetical protein [Verminephrobacter eiseniae]MCW8185160.1 hypothetical protein [Verminephrobacter eiseniae]MCW8223825.1 hypothetical protein [Verminephrobacter eiseniae]